MTNNLDVVCRRDRFSKLPARLVALRLSEMSPKKRDALPTFDFTLARKPPRCVRVNHDLPKKCLVPTAAFCICQVAACFPLSVSNFD